MKKIILLIEIIKGKFVKNDKIIKIFSILLSTTMFYIFGNKKGSSLIFQKKYVIQYLKNFLLIYLNNIEFIPSINYIPNISVIIPLYNCQNTIEMSIKSIEMQNFQQ